MKPLLAILLATTCAVGFPCKVTWLIAPAQVGVGFKVVKLEGSNQVTLGETSGNNLTVEVKAGDRISIIATSKHFPDAPPSPPITIPEPPENLTILAVPIQISTDLKTWKSTLILIPENMTENGKLPKSLFIKP